MAALILKQIERGSVSFGSTALTVTGVLSTTLTDTSKTVLLFSMNCGSADAVNYNVLGRVGSTTQIFFEREATPNTAVTIEYQVLEFTQGIYVQHMYFTQTAATTDTAISTIDTSKTFPILTMTQDGATFGANDVASADITSTTNLRTFMGSYLSCQIAVQVIQIDDATVQRVAGSYGTTDVCDVAVSSITENKTFWVFSISQTGSFAFTGVPYLYYFNSTTLRFIRAGSTGAANHSYIVYAVSLSTGVTVQNVTATIAGSSTTASPTIPSPITVAKSALLITGLMQRHGMIDASDDDSGGNHFLLTNLTTTGFSATRVDSPLVSTTTNVQVLEFVTSSSLAFPKINVGGAWRNVTAMNINIGGAWRTVTSANINVSGSWKSLV